MSKKHKEVVSEMKTRRCFKCDKSYKEGRYTFDSGLCPDCKSGILFDQIVKGE